VAAWNNHLPAGFSNWDLADNEGWTVAHEAAFYGHLPEGFDQWGLKDNDGKTVEDVLRENHPELLQKHGLGAKERTIIGNDVFFYEVTPTASQYIKNQVKELFYGLQVTIDKLDGVETKPLPQWKVSLDKKYTCLALEKDGIVIGALKGKIERKAFHINSLVVRDDCRNKGYGMFLLGKAKGLMTKRGVKEWHLRAHCKNDIALRLYKKFGFETRSYNMAQKLT
jgi:ribosomal protein S18 acetylase RimI-like enzyme